ncbi:hypothetical protein B0H67DRAFT_580168 [Lasiosphaeris hirsuta]|uniref:DNA-directed RNA polymerase n=1 Tax=Lasiosphaeris hirsuta TaxID=260670 RepID=A0AA40DTR4_9PEZI|nr:hypothetical protein B0H67DRAFT_580168 [Lasiosphaeris hirsuta]
MLVRSGVVRQSLPLRHLLSSTSLRFTTQCPSLSIRRAAPDSHRSLSTKQELRPWKRKDYRALAGFERHLATALDDCRPTDDIAFEGLPNSITSAYRPSPSQPPIYELRSFDAADTLRVKPQLATTPRSRVNPHGIPGDVEEMLSVFDACIQVGKLERASLVLKRFGAMNILAPEVLMELHNVYLHERLAQIQDDPSLDGADDIHKWFELQIRHPRLQHTADTIAYMLKASLITSRGSRLVRLLERYMGMLPQMSALESLFMVDVLNAKDLATISELCPEYNMLDYSVNTDNVTSDSLSANELDESARQVEHHARQDVLQALQALPGSSESVPEVMGTPQKGVGLKVLKSTLSLFSDIPPGLDIGTLSREQQREIQMRLEKDCIDAALSRWREENQALLSMGLNTTLSSPSLSARLFDWHKDLEARIVDELQKIEVSEAVVLKGKEDLDRCLYGPFLRQSSPSRLAAVTILSSLSAIAMSGADKGILLTSIVSQVARITEQDIRSQLQSAGRPRDKKGVQKGGARRLMRNASSQRLAANAAANAAAAQSSTTGNAPSNVVFEHKEDPLREDRPWPVNIRTQVGAALLSALIETAKVRVVREHPETKALVTQMQPAFTHTTSLKKGRKVGTIVPNRALVELLKREPRSDMLTSQLPMVVEPEPWTSFDKGGFITSYAPLLRVKNGEREQRIYTDAAVARGDMDQILKGLNVLGKTAWKINQQVFDVMLEAWNTGKPIANLPALNPDIPIPPEPNSTDDPWKKRLWIRDVKAAENEKSGLHSVRCFMNFQLEISRALRDQTFYFPHNIDFRGRAYPIPTYLNHMGADHVRGLLRFAKGKKLGETGLRWLKIHLSNVYGFDKASFQERENFAMDNLDNIFDSADNPLNGKRWWLEAEDPWQTLATCFELKAALQSPVPADYVSSMPVHQDGTCNGLQHYAALGGDTWGAQQVNLLPGDRPSDVYSAVAQLVRNSIDQDIADGVTIAKIFKDKITRKVVKQTVMTNVYGVTFVGARAQVAKQLNDLYPNMVKNSGLDMKILSTYVTKRVFGALSTMFRGAHDIQSWLGEIGSRVCRAVSPEQIARIAGDLEKNKMEKGKLDKHKSLGNKTLQAALPDLFHSTLVWTTPLRMPVVQPYRKSATRSITTCLQELVMTIPDRADPVHSRKQLQAFPPNFIHSLDASHMILSALECDERGLTFAAVHDSFWTHASDVDTMNGVIRDSFIRIHSDDVIGRLAAEFRARFKGSIYTGKIIRKSATAKAILEFRKTQRLSWADELIMEKKRQDLLSSSNPDDVEAGKAMVTPASIFEEMSVRENLSVVAEENPAAGLGDVSGGMLSKGERSVEAPDEDGASDDLEVNEVESEPAADDEDREVEVKPLSFLEYAGTNHFAMHVAGRMYRPEPAAPASIQLWLPLTFPDVPEKGDFNVQDLKDSKYFFS